MYGEFAITLGQMNGICMEYESVYQKIKAVPENIGQIKNALSGETYADVKVVLEKLAEEVGHQSALVQKMNQTLSNCAKEYTKKQYPLCGQRQAVQEPLRLPSSRF